MSDRLISRDDAQSDSLAAAAFVAERIESSDGRAEAMNAVVPRLLARGNVDLAAALSDTIDDPYSRDRLLIMVAERCVDLNDDDYARQLADAIEDDAMRSQALENVAIRTAARGDSEAAREIASEVVHPDYVEAAIAARAAADGDTDTATATIAAIEFSGAKVAAYQEIASSAIGNDRATVAVAFLSDAVVAAAETEHEEEKIRSLCNIGSLFVDAGRNDLAAETFLRAREFAQQLDNVHRDNFLSSCAVGLIHSEHLDEADATMDLISDKTQMASAMLGLARDEWRRNEKEAAFETLDEAYEILCSQHEKETRDSRARNALIGAIAVQYAGFGKTEKAVSIAEEILDTEDQVSALSQIARILIVQKEDDLSRATIAKIPDEERRCLAMIGVSNELRKREGNDAATAVLDEVFQMSNAIDRPVAKSQVLSETAKRFLAGDFPEKAREVSLANFEVIATIRDESKRGESLAAASEIYESDKLEIGDQEKAALLEIMKKSPF